MTTTIDVSPKQDFWHRLCRTRPLRAISEMVWNALDADARNVQMECRLNPLGGLEEIVIKDDGSGIPYDVGVEHRFAALGGSWKARVSRTEGRRLMHGRYGEGRFRAFALGGMVTWETTFKNADKLSTYEINGTASGPGKFILTDVKDSSGSQTGTTVYIRNPEKLDGILLSSEFKEDVARIFAPYLLNYRDIKLVVNGRDIDAVGIVSRQRVQSRTNTPERWSDDFGRSRDRGMELNYRTCALSLRRERFCAVGARS
jgi:hypothetical protein